MHFRAFLFLLLAISLPIRTTASPTPRAVAVAATIAKEQFPNFRYGDRLDRGEVNCVQFIGAVVRRLIERPLTKAEEDAIYIRYRFPDFAEALQRGDPRMRGVAKALVDDLKIADYVPPQRAAPGDFIQYWIKQKDGSWMGHSAIVASRVPRADGRVAVSLYGAHKSFGGIGETFLDGHGLLLSGKDRWFFLARLHEQTPGKNKSR